MNNKLKITTAVWLLTSLFLTGCGDTTDSQAGVLYNDGTGNNGGNGGGETQDFDKAKLLTSLSDNVLVPTYQSFAQISQSQTDAISAYCSGLSSQQSEQTELKTQAKAAWVNAMNQWQQIELMQVGPLTSNESKLRNSIYSWPITNSCAVDQDVGHYEKGDISGINYDITRRTANRKGLDAIEYLLFNDNLNHSCPSDSHAPTNWNQRPQIERLVARCEFAQALSTDITVQADNLVSQWQGDSSFKNTLLNAGNGNNQFKDLLDAINHISDAMFYLDSITKDIKLAAPIGLATNSCGAAACLDDIESKLSHNSVNNVKHNLMGLLHLFQGSIDDDSGTGFDDFLVAAEQSELAATMLNDIKAAITTADTFDGTFTDAVNQSPEKIEALHQAVKNVTDNLKSVFITYLSLELPLTSAGDAD